MLDLTSGCRILDAPCGWGRLCRPLALMGATVLGVDQSEAMLAMAERNRGELSLDRLRYLRHDLRTPLAEGGFDVACNIFTSFGYGTEAEDIAIFRTLRGAVRPGGQVVVETSHRDLMCILMAHGAKSSKRLPDGTLFLDESDFDPIAGVARLHWYWSGPKGQVKSTRNGGVIHRHRLLSCCSKQVFVSALRTKASRRFLTGQRVVRQVPD